VLKISFVKVMRWDKRTGGEIRTVEKDRQKGIRREIRGLSNQPTHPAILDRRTKKADKPAQINSALNRLNCPAVTTMAIGPLRQPIPHLRRVIVRRDD
jgi:hypothetical protein